VKSVETKAEGKLERLAAVWLRSSGHADRLVSFVAFLLMIAVVFGDVLSRELTGTGVHWARQAGVYANIFVVMFGIGIASAERGHLRPRFADRWLPAAWDPALSRIGDGLMGLFCLAFAGVAAGVVAETFALQERSTVLRIVVWPFQAVMPLVFVLAAIRHALYAIYPGLAPVAPAAAPVN
jgi:TRAP-type C4-dicarboxylate transport system permease small subunit